MSEETETAAEETATETTETTEDKGTTSTADAIAAAAADASSSEESDESKDSEETTASESKGTKDSEDGQSSEDEPPTEYSAFEVPEGVELSEEDVASFSEAFKAKGFSQEEAQSFMNKVTGFVSDRVLPGVLKTQEDAYAKQEAEWLEQAKANPFLAGEDGEEFDSSVAIAGKFLASVANSKEVKKAMPDVDVIGTAKELGWLSHPAGMVILKAAGMKTLPDRMDSRGDGAGVIDDWENTPAHLRMTSWGSDAGASRTGKGAE